MKRMAITAVVAMMLLLSFGSAASASQAVNPKVQHWYLHEGGKHYVQLVDLELRTIDKAFQTLAGESSQSAAVAEANVLGDACQVMTTDLVQLGFKLSPIPDKGLERRWSKALSQLKNGTAACVAGASALNSSKLNQAGSQFNSALDILKSLKF